MDTTPSSRRRGVRVPYLALKHAAGSDHHPVFFSVLENKTIDTDVTGELENSNCWATPQGWILVRDAAASSTYLLDPHDRRARIQLPHLPEDDLPPVCTCLLSDHPDPADPGRGNCLVLLVEPDNPIIRYCHIGGGGEWVKYEYDIGTLDLPDLGEGCKEKLVICSIAACGGRFYFNGFFDELGVLELGPAPAFGSVAIRDPIEQPFGCQKVYLVESRGELFMVSLLSPSDPSVVRRVLVHRMDFARREWREAADIGGRAFLVSPWYFGASRPAAADCGLEPDCVYAAFAGTKRLLVFSVKDGTMRMQDLDGAPVSKLALWMLPTYYP